MKPHAKKIIWVVVADEAIARILEWPQRGDELQPVEEFTDPMAHASGTELRRDAHGRRGSTVTASAGDDETHQEAERFAQHVADHLTAALQQKRFDELCIAAAPRFLGLLRKALGGEVSRRVSKEVDKDLIHLDNRDIGERLSLGSSTTSQRT